MTQTSRLIVLVCLLSTVAAIPVRQSQLLSAMQRQYEARAAKEAGYLQELEAEPTGQEPESGKVSSNGEAEQSSTADSNIREPLLPITLPLPNLRKNKMLGYFGLYSPAALSAAAAAAYAQPYGYPLYHSMLDYYDDYLPVDNYPSLNMLANMQTYPQNVYANMANGMGSYQTMSNLSPNLQQQLNSLVQQQQQQQQQIGQQQQQQQQQQATNPQLANLAGLDANAAALGSFQSLAASFAAGNDNFQSLDDEDILSRHSQAGRRRPAVKNSPIYYIRLPPTPYMFVPGVGYISQPPTIQPMAAPVPQYPQLAPPPPVTMSPFYQLPINFVSNGKPSGIYQWNGAPAAPAVPPQPAFALPYPRPQRPAFAPSPFIQDSKITHLKGPFLFNGRPEEIFLLQNTFNPLYQSPLNSYY
uniref:Uncharacterized protein n=1 Tax=Anopheles coluzzii TaxID=1518534 RepID=A0A8W7Q3K5_ANOCL